MMKIKQQLPSALTEQRESVDLAISYLDQLIGLKNSN
jgi:hypothetical protein